MKISGSRWISALFLMTMILALAFSALMTPVAYAVTEEEIQNAIDWGLEWLAKQQRGDGSWESYGWTVGPTAEAVLAFEQQGYLPTGDPGVDPYVDVVRKGLEYIFSRAEIHDISGPDYACPYGNPDTNGNGKGIAFAGQSMYETGMAIRAIVASQATHLTASIGG